MAASSGMVVDIDDGTVIGSMVEWIRDNYGIIIPSGYLTYMPDSGDRFFGAMLSAAGPVVEGVNWFVCPER